MTTSPILYTSKMDAAKRQIETAITLYFKKMDPISIHTLSAASYDILHALCKAQNIDGAFVKNAENVRPEKKDEYLKMVNAAQNFFKHGHKDGNKTYDFRPETTAFLIYDACNMYHNITKEKPKLMFLFIVWFSFLHPDILSHSEGKEMMDKMGKFFTKNDREAFFSNMSPIYDQNLLN